MTPANHLIALTIPIMNLLPKTLQTLKALGFNLGSFRVSGEFREFVVFRGCWKAEFRKFKGFRVSGWI